MIDALPLVVLDLDGVLAYGATQDEARANVDALAAQVLAEQATINARP